MPTECASTANLTLNVDDVDVLLMRFATGDLHHADLIDAIADLLTTARQGVPREPAPKPTGPTSQAGAVPAHTRAELLGFAADMAATRHAQGLPGEQRAWQDMLTLLIAALPT